jgi:hypothetical protein
MADNKETLRAKFLQTGELLTGTNKTAVNYAAAIQSDEFVAIRPQIKQQKTTGLNSEKQRLPEEQKYKITSELEIEKQKILGEYRHKITAELETEKQKILDEYRYKIASEQLQIEEKQKAAALEKKSAKKPLGIVKFFKVSGFIAIIAFLFVLIRNHNSTWKELLSIVLTYYKVTT